MSYFKKIDHILYLTVVALITLSSILSGQRRGDNLAFQGLNDVNATGVKAAAMGGADIANAGDLSSIFSNPAGLADITTYKISYTANNYEKKWWENQDYRPNRQFTNLSFILDGLYYPNPENNGKYDFDAFLDDTTYIVNDPTLGLDPYSEEAALWRKTESDFIFNNLALAVPFSISEIPFVVSAAYGQQNNILDYDRNNTSLDPHIGFNGYAPIEERVTSAEDTLRVNWFDYKRVKNGSLKQITGAISSQVTDYLNVGFGVNVINGESDDFYSLDKIGYFDLLEAANTFQFSYDTLNSSISGTSDYSGMNFTIGTVIKLNRINIGLKINTPYTLERKWDYESIQADTDTSIISNLKGVDEVDLPITYAIGVSFNPIDEFRIAVDLEKANYSKAEFNIANPDSNSSDWVDQTILRVGAEYQVYDFITLLAGYRNKTEIFVPDGAAIKDSGPNATTYSLGMSLEFDVVRLDLAYEMREMQYIDSYFSNTNYNTQTYSNVLLGFVLSL